VDCAKPALYLDASDYGRCVPRDQVEGKTPKALALTEFV
jgi:hypothetical protein